MNKRILLVAVGGAALVALLIGYVAARRVVVDHLSADSLVRKVEEQWNCRAHIGSSEVLPEGGKVLLTEVAIGPRDQYADAGAPLAERPPMESPEITASSVELVIDAAELARDRISIRKLDIKDAVVLSQVDEEGAVSLEALFAPIETTAAAPPVEPATGVQSQAGEADQVGSEGDGAVVEFAAPEGSLSAPGGDTTTGGDDDGFSAGDLPTSTVAEAVHFSNARVETLLEDSNGLITLSDLEVRLSHIDVDPDDLLNHNRALFQVEGNLTVHPADQRDGPAYVTMAFTGQGSMRPFDPIDGALDPEWDSSLVIREGSQLNTFPILERLKEKLDGIDTGGVDLSDLELQGNLSRDVSTRLAQSHGRLKFLEPAALPLSGNLLVLKEDSWIHLGDSQHEIRGTVIASQQLTEQVQEKVGQYLEEKAGSLASDGLRDTLLSPAMRDGRIALDFVSEGDLGDPEPDIVTPFGKLGDLIEDGKKALDSLKDAFKGLFK